MYCFAINGLYVSKAVERYMWEWDKLLQSNDLKWVVSNKKPNIKKLKFYWLLWTYETDCYIVDDMIFIWDSITDAITFAEYYNNIV